MVLLSLTAKAAEPYAVLYNGTLTFYYDNFKSSRSGKVYPIKTRYYSPYAWSDVSNNDLPAWYEDEAEIIRANFNPSFKQYELPYFDNWFYQLSNLESISGCNNINTSNTITMRCTFFRCPKLKTLDVSSLNTANVVNMHAMFEGCESIEELDVSHFNTAKVQVMSDMFYGLDNIKALDVSNFNTANVTSMAYMFGCKNLQNLDLSSFDTHNVTNMDGMFENCKSLTKIVAGKDWQLGNTVSGINIFENCTSLTGDKNTAYSYAHRDISYAHIDGGTSNPGYLSDDMATYIVSATGATGASDTTPDNVYDLSGRLVRRNVIHPELLPQGTYIYKGKKIINP